MSEHVKNSKKKLKPLNSVIQVCPDCGKVDTYKDDNHSCFINMQRQINDEYYD